MLTFKRSGATLEQIAELEKLGIRYKKYQKKELLAASSIGPADAVAVSLLEDKVGLLPAEYRAFLQAHNGGIPSYCKLPGGLGVALFFSCVDKIHLNGSLLHQYELFGKKPWLPIATNAGGDRYLLKLEGSDAGAIYFDEHDAYEGDKQARRKVANSFSEFLTLLH